MVHFLKSALNCKFFIITLTASILFISCKKEDHTSSEWGELATAKMNEIKELSSNIPCAVQSGVTIQQILYGCSPHYFAIQDADLTKFEKLKKEYLDFTGKQYSAWSREGLIVEPCHESIWVAEQPIRLECKADKVQLITSENVSIEEAGALAQSTYQQIMSKVNDMSCSGVGGLTYTALINYELMKIEFIPYSRTSNYQELKEKVSVYNRLAFRLVQAAGTGNNFQHQKEVETIECVNGKPVIKYRN